MYSMENQLKVRRVRSLHSLVQVEAATGVTIGAMEMSSKPSGKGKKLPFPARHLIQMWERQTPKSNRTAKLVDAVCRGCGKKGHFEKVCLKAKCSTHSLEVPQASTSTVGAGASEPLYFDDDGQPVYTLIWSVSLM